jgi:hypothetical protein
MQRELGTLSHLEEPNGATDEEDECSSERTNPASSAVMCERHTQYLVLGEVNR